MLLEHSVLVYHISNFWQALSNLRVGEDADGFGLLILEVHFWVKSHSLDDRWLKCFRFCPQYFGRSHDAVAICPQELQNPKVSRAVRCTSLQIYREELPVLAHVTGHRMDHFGVAEQSRTADESQCALRNLITHSAFAEPRW